MNTRRGVDHCSGDNLPEVKVSFDKILESRSEPSKFEDKLRSLRVNEESFDLFMTYWTIKKVHPDAGLECLHSNSDYNHINVELDEIPMPPSHTPFPDLVEVYLAETMLGRELNEYEKDGTTPIPKISEEGDFYWAPLHWGLFPLDYMSSKKASNEILDLEPLDKVFDFEAIKGIYKGR
jgi:hypothetical protein